MISYFVGTNTNCYKNGRRYEDKQEHVEYEQKNQVKQKKTLQNQIKNKSKSTKESQPSEQFIFSHNQMETGSKNARNKNISIIDSCEDENVNQIIQQKRNSYSSSESENSIKSHNEQEYLENYQDDKIEEQKAKKFSIKESENCNFFPQFLIKLKKDNDYFNIEEEIEDDEINQNNKQLLQVLKLPGYPSKYQKDNQKNEEEYYLQSSLTQKLNNSTVKERTHSIKSNKSKPITEDQQKENSRVQDEQEIIADKFTYSSYFTAMKQRLVLERQSSNFFENSFFNQRQNSNQISQKQGSNIFEEFKNENGMNLQEKQLKKINSKTIFSNPSYQHLNQSSLNYLRIKFQDQEEVEDEANIEADDTELKTEQVIKIQETIRMRKINSAISQNQLIDYHNNNHPQKFNTNYFISEVFDSENHLLQNLESQINKQKIENNQQIFTFESNNIQDTLPILIIPENQQSNNYLHQLQEQNFQENSKRKSSLKMINRKSKIFGSPTQSINSIFMVNREIISIKDFSKVHKNDLFEQSQNLAEIGVCLFNAAPLSGLFFMIIIGYLKADSKDIYEFIMSKEQFTEKKQHPSIKKSEQAITEILTELSLLELPQILKNYACSFDFSNMNFMYALRQFSGALQLDNDPEKVDVLLQAFSQRYFQQNSNNIIEDRMDETSKSFSYSYSNIKKDNNLQVFEQLHLMENTSFNQQFSPSLSLNKLNTIENENNNNNNSSNHKRKSSTFKVNENTLFKFTLNNEEQNDKVVSSNQFYSADSVHMLAFATLMLDIDIHFYKQKDLTNLFEEFQQSTKGINEGRDFSKDFLNDIFSNSKNKNITQIITDQIINKQKSYYVEIFNNLLFKKAQLCVNVFRKKGEELVLLILEGMAIVINKNHVQAPLSYISFFSLKCLIISYSNKVLLLKPAEILGKQSICMAKLSKSKIFILKEKEQVSFFLQGEEQGELFYQNLRSLFSTPQPQIKD